MWQFPSPCHLEVYTGIPESSYKVVHIFAFLKILTSSYFTYQELKCKDSIMMLAFSLCYCLCIFSFLVVTFDGLFHIT